MSFLELIKLQRNSDKYSLLKNDATTETDREDFVYTKVSSHTQIEHSNEKLTIIFV